jgi:type IV pilus assembly protein PilN
MFEKLKNVKFPKLSLGKKNIQIKDSQQPSKQNKFKKILFNFLKSKLSRMSVTSEEIVGVDVTQEAVRVAQVSKDKNGKWILDKFSYRSLDKEKIGDNLLDSKDYLAEQIKLALANAKVTTKNAALSIPSTSAVIKSPTTPLMNEQELKQAIKTESLWGEVIQMDNIEDYSVFHQVINRNSKTNEMDLLFVASKLSDVNAHTSIINKAGLNPVIMDVRCFTLKNALDNSVFEDNKKQSAILEFGLSDNYLMIIYNNTPIITHIFLRPQEKQNLVMAKESNLSDPEIENVIRRYVMQVKQALDEHETRYKTKINSISVVSSLKNIKQLLPIFRKNLPTTGFKLYDPLSSMSVPAYNKEKVNLDNRSTITSVLGLAYRKLDVFGYYKFVTAVKNINLLPNRDAVRQQNKIKFLSGFAFKGLAATIAIIYFVLIGFSLTQYHFNKEKLLVFNEIQENFTKVQKRISPLVRKRDEMKASIDISENLKSNQSQSYRALAQVARSVPGRLIFKKIEYNGENQILIEGLAFENGDVNNFNKNINQKSLIKLSIVDGTTAATLEQTKSTSMNRSFKIRVTLNFSENGEGT